MHASNNPHNQIAKYLESFKLKISPWKSQLYLIFSKGIFAKMLLPLAESENKPYLSNTTPKVHPTESDTVITNDFPLLLLASNTLNSFSAVHSNIHYLVPKDHNPQSKLFFKCYITGTDNEFKSSSHIMTTNLSHLTVKPLILFHFS